MKPENILKVVQGLPHMTFEQALEITAFILEHKLTNILELGFKYGVSTCYLAGALQEMGGGQITTIDFENAKSAAPNIEALLKKIALSKFVKIYYEPTSYIWRLMKLIEENPQPLFNLCYLDGAHDWFVDGFAFFLVDKLLLPGGWIIFDDIDWTYAFSPALKDTARTTNMPKEERETKQIRKVYELLVKPHPDYNNFQVKGDWAYAQKAGSSSANNKPKLEIIYQREYVGLPAALTRVLKRIFKRLNL